MAEPFLFNLSTLYELRSAVAANKKRELLGKVAKWSGDGLRTPCLKMPVELFTSGYTREYLYEYL
ncbi:hypothetical protein OF83DRAFT_1180414 [Amylostereum chailletii]|nr:hypothetical protein OF83DRAFT_1180414 [Amylostereum chailletii]